MTSDTSERLGLLWRAWRYRLRLDPHEIRYLLGHVSPGQCAVDIGAHKGGYTYWLQRAVGASGRVVAFEPQPRLATALAGALTAAGMTNVVVENAAVSDRCGEVRLVVPAGTSTCGATLEHRDDVRESFTVRSVTLDEYFRANPALRVAFVKCDVEGHELSVFMGAERILREHRPVLMFECEARHHGGPIEVVFQHLRARRYEGFFFWRGEPRPVSEFRPETHASPGRKPYVNNFVFTAGP